MLGVTASGIIDLLARLVELGVFCLVELGVLSLVKLGVLGVFGLLPDRDFGVAGTG